MSLKLRENMALFYEKKRNVFFIYKRNAYFSIAALKASAVVAGAKTGLPAASKSVTSLSVHSVVRTM